MRRRLAAVPLVAILAVGASLALAQVQPGKGWIDQPLGWEVIIAGPVAVTAHLTHPGGVTEARLMVNGEKIDQVPLGGETLETVEFSWDPPGSGQYLVEVFGGNEWGIPGTVEVTVALGEEPVDTTTTTEGTTTTVGGTTTTKGSTTTNPTTSTTSPTTTSTASTTPSITTTTVCNPVPALNGSDVSGTFVTLRWTYSGCLDPLEYWIQLSQRYGFEGAIDYFVPGDSLTFSEGPLACGDWYWHIKVLLPEESTWSSLGTFNIAVRDCP